MTHSYFSHYLEVFNETTEEYEDLEVTIGFHVEYETLDNCQVAPVVNVYQIGSKVTPAEFTKMEDRLVQTVLDNWA